MSWSAKAWTPSDFATFAPVVVDEAETTSRISDEAYARGFAEGRAEGEVAERARLRSAVRAAEESAEAIDAANAHWTGAAQENITALAVAIARHIVDRELSLDPAVVGKLVTRAVAEYPVDQPLRLRLNPDDLAVLAALEQHGMQDIAERSERSMRWIGDSRISPGGCVVEGQERIVDGRIETALERVYRRLTHNHA